MYKKKGVTLIELIVYLALLSIILSFSISLIGLARMQKNRIDTEVTIRSIEDLFMYAKEYCLSNEEEGQILVDVTISKIRFINKQRDEAKVLKIENATINPESMTTCSIATNGRIKKGGTIKLTTKDKKEIKITIGVGVDNINVKSGELYEIE